MPHLPQPSDYNNAIQNPKTAFGDPQLQNCRVETDDHGLPRARSGGFALAYHLQSNEGSWAVRCFFRQIPADLRHRYDAIGKFIRSNRGSAREFVPAVFVPNGIRVGGVWYPIVKMDWVNGLTLDQYIERNLLHQKALSWLPSHFRNLVSELEHLGIAHGDLQHGNIMIHSEDSSMVLVDYDAMYLPELSGMTSNETGHRNYQHPTRLKQYDNRIDRFSSLVIFTALESILERHNLWRKYSTGENMIFTREDFISPETSAVFREVCALQRSGRSGLELKEICKTANYNSVPRLEDFISNEKNYTPEKFVPYSDSISGKIVEIQGVQYTSQGTPFARIVFSDGDVAWVWPPALSLFKEPSKYLGQNVSVKGQRLQDHLEFRNSSEISPLEEPRRATESFIAPSPLPTHPSTTRHSYFWVVPLLAGGIIGLVGWGFSPLASFAVWVTSIVFSYLVKRQGLSLGEASITYPRPPVQPTVHMHRGMPCKMPLAWDPSKGRWYCYKQQDYPD